MVTGISGSTPPVGPSSSASLSQKIEEYASCLNKLYDEAARYFNHVHYQPHLDPLVQQLDSLTTYLKTVPGTDPDQLTAIANYVGHLSELLKCPYLALIPGEFGFTAAAYAVSPNWQPQTGNSINLTVTGLGINITLPGLTPTFMV